MVKLNRIYTRTGDDGTTGLVGGQRVAKDDRRVEAFGDVDEANAAIGAAIVAASEAPGAPSAWSRIAETLRSVQHDLFDAGADLANPRREGEKPEGTLRIIASQTDRLETLIDEFNDSLAPLNSFVLPGGSSLAAWLHVARTIVRRAERGAVGLRGEASPEVVRYLNRLSDLLFVLARAANDNGRSDTLWKPGANRPKV